MLVDFGDVNVFGIELFCAARVVFEQQNVVAHLIQLVSDDAIAGAQDPLRVIGICSGEEAQPGSFMAAIFFTADVGDKIPIGDSLDIAAVAILKLFGRVGVAVVGVCGAGGLVPVHLAREAEFFEPLPVGGRLRHEPKRRRHGAKHRHEGEPARVVVFGGMPKPSRSVPISR